MASNSATRSLFAVVFPLFADAMYKRLGTVGATALLAGLTTVMSPLPYVHPHSHVYTIFISKARFFFHCIGHRLRRNSPFAAP